MTHLTSHHRGSIELLWFDFCWDLESIFLRGFFTSWSIFLIICLLCKQPLEFYSHSTVISNFTLCENPLGVMKTDQGPVLFCIWFESSLSLRHQLASTCTYRTDASWLQYHLSPSVLHKTSILFLTDLYDHWVSLQDVTERDVDSHRHMAGVHNELSDWLICSHGNSEGEWLPHTWP